MSTQKSTTDRLPRTYCYVDPVLTGNNVEYILELYAGILDILMEYDEVFVLVSSIYKETLFEWANNMATVLSKMRGPVTGQGVDCKVDMLDNGTFLVWIYKQ